MQEAHLEHANLTASNPDAMAAILCDIFDWQIRWSGEAMDNGYTVHVGGDNSYIAIYTNDRVRAAIVTTTIKIHVLDLVQIFIFTC